MNLEKSVVEHNLRKLRSVETFIEEYLAEHGTINKPMNGSSIGPDPALSPFRRAGQFYLYEVNEVNE